MFFVLGTAEREPVFKTPYTEDEDGRCKCKLSTMPFDFEGQMPFYLESQMFPKRPLKTFFLNPLLLVSLSDLTAK